MCRKIQPLRDRAEDLPGAARWFHARWGVPLRAYLDSMERCIRLASPVPQWYTVTDGTQIIAGAGVIENDFHLRTDLTPNLCALFVEENFRRRGLAGQLLDFICRDMQRMGIDTLYLVTDHTAFYERYGWKFLCMVQESGSPRLTRMYIHKTQL